MAGERQHSRRRPCVDGASPWLVERDLERRVGVEGALLLDAVGRPLAADPQLQALARELVDREAALGVRHAAGAAVRADGREGHEGVLHRLACAHHDDAHRDRLEARRRDQRDRPRATGARDRERLQYAYGT